MRRSSGTAVRSIPSRESPEHLRGGRKATGLADETAAGRFVLQRIDELRLGPPQTSPFEDCTDLLTDSPTLQTAWRLFVNTLPYALGTGLFAYIYKYVTDVKVMWGTVLPGAVLAGTLFELAKLGFVIYLDNYANFHQVYGGISTVVVLMLWFYVVAIILVLGAEVSGEYGRSRASGRLRFRGQLRPIRGGLAPATHMRTAVAPTE